MSKVSIDLIRTNKLAIYLLKSSLTKVEEAVDITNTKLLRVNIQEVGTLFYAESHSYTPGWIETFFKNHSSIDPKLFKNSSAKAVLVIKIRYRTKDRFFAIPFGAGRFLLKDDVYEERFGLKTTINLVEAGKIKSLGKKTLSDNPKLNIEQTSKESSISDFQIDIEKDIVNSITGKSSNASFGKFLTGKDSLSVSTKLDITNIRSFLTQCLRHYNSNKYKAQFEWIDFIREISDASLIDALDEELVDVVKRKGDNAWLTVPDIIDWTDVWGYKYSSSKTDPIHEELLLHDFIEENDEIDLDIAYLKSSSITVWSNSTGQISKRWPAYKCLNAEILDKKMGCFLLDGGKWYEIKRSFVQEVNRFVDNIPRSKLTYIKYKHNGEGPYNKALATALGAHCLDKDNLSYGDGHSKVEVCDVLTKKNNLLFVKRYSSSSAMSHLFSQGYVTGELLIGDASFRKEVIRILPKSFKTVIPSEKAIFKAESFTLTYVIITKKKSQQLPFFSKVNLRAFYKRLTLYHYKIEIAYVV